MFVPSANNKVQYPQSLKTFANLACDAIIVSPLVALRFQHAPLVALGAGFAATAATHLYTKWNEAKTQKLNSLRPLN